MTMKTYQARTMAEAIAQVKQEMGRDAVILQTRRRRKGVLGVLGGRRMWEVTASPNMNVPRRIVEGQYVSETTCEQAVAEVAAPAPVQSQPVRPVAPSQVDALGQELGRIRGMVEALYNMRVENNAAAETPCELASLRTNLLDQDVQEHLADELLGQLRASLTGMQLADSELVNLTLQQMIADRIETVADEPSRVNTGKARTIALIGPTGVGKTTTIAKLAARYKLRENRRVGLITIDTYRIAAVDQLRTYADIINVPLEVVLSAGELHRAVHDMRDMDVVLIDTAGRSHNDEMRLNQLRSFVAAAGADEVHLVVTATANYKCSATIMERFKPLGANRLIITKLDEAATFGPVLNCAVAANTPISYVTTGQDVPDDIAMADANRLAGMITGGALYES